MKLINFLICRRTEALRNDLGVGLWGIELFFGYVWVTGEFRKVHRPAYEVHSMNLA